VLFIAQRLGYLIKEVPVSWHDEPGTKVRLWKGAVRSLLGLATIRVNFLRGRYKPSAERCASTRKQNQKRGTTLLVILLVSNFGH
jgi:hypothetical protein